MPRGSVRLAALGALALALAACDPYVEGNGYYAEVVRTPGPFAGVAVDDAIQAIANVSPGASYTVTLSGDANIVDEYVKAEVRAIDVGGTFVDVLHVWVDEPSSGYSPTIPIRATILAAPPIRYLAASRAARIEANEISVPQLDVKATGGGYVEAKGPAPAGATLSATFDGGHGELGAYPVGDAAVQLSGASSLKVSASGALTGEARGTSTLTNLVAAASCTVAALESATVVCGPTPP